MSSKKRKSAPKTINEQREHVANVHPIVTLNSDGNCEASVWWYGNATKPGHREYCTFKIKGHPERHSFALPAA